MSNDIKDPFTKRHMSIFGCIFAAIGCVCFALQHNLTLVVVGLGLVGLNLYNALGE